MSHSRIALPRTLVARAGRRPHPVRPVPARLQAARGPARPVLRAQDGGRQDGAHHLRPLLRLLRRPDREEAAQPLLPGLVGVFLRHRRLQPGLQVLPELGHLQVARDRHHGRPGHARGDRRRRREERLQERGLHLQRPGDLRRVRDGRGRCLPRARPQDRGGHRRLHPRRAAARVLRQDGRGQRRPQGLHRRLLLQADRRPPAAGARHADLPEARDRRLVRDHHAADPRPQRFRRRDSRR